MKPVEYASIGGFVFPMEDDACAAVKSYLAELESFYSSRPSGSEIMEGIEERMAELMIEKCGSGGVVSIGAVDSIIETLGKPEAIENESDSFEEPEESKASGESASTRSESHRWEESKSQKKAEGVRKRLYRDTSNGKIAGVCSGLGAYLNIDPLVFRLVFVALVICAMFSGWEEVGFFTPLIVYAVLWICMPAARTVRQKDEMKGVKGTVDAISSRISSGASEIRDAAQRVGSEGTIGKIFRIFIVIIGFGFLLAGLAGSTALGTFAAGQKFSFGASYVSSKLLESLANADPAFVTLLSMKPAAIALAMIAVLPFIFFIYIGIKLIFGMKEPSWKPSLWLFLIWVIAIVVFSVYAVMTLPVWM